MERKRKSRIWLIGKDELKTIVEKSKTIAEIMISLGFSANKGGSYKGLKKRMELDGIDYSHIPLGRHSNKNRVFGGVKAVDLESVLVEHSTYSRGELKRRLIKNGMLNNVCYRCGQGPFWNEEKLVLVLDHINGTFDDNRIENLRLLCPNCNSQTTTFSGRNNIKIKYYCECGKEIWKGSLKCNKCASIENGYKCRKVKERPSKDKLTEEIANSSFLEVGRKYGVSDNAIRKWLE